MALTPLESVGRAMAILGPRGYPRPAWVTHGFTCVRPAWLTGRWIKTKQSNKAEQPIVLR